jgi:hypothetical protein
LYFTAKKNERVLKGIGRVFKINEFGNEKMVKYAT